MSDTPVIAIESPLQDEVRVLIGELNAELLRLTPPEACHHMSAEQMAQQDTTLFVARVGGRAVAIGALRRHADGIGEVKRMYTLPEMQGRGIGGAILSAIEGLAAREGIARLVLETGNQHPAAWRVYERGGFNRCSPVLDYPGGPLYVFYEKTLTT